MAIKKDDVFRVADAMFADGVSPSLVGVRAALGSGSYSTIAGFLAEWKSATRSAPVVGVDEVPEEVSEVFAPALRSMWAMAQQLAQDELEKAKDALRSELAAAAGRETEALELAQVLQAENDLMVSAAMEKQRELERLQENLDSLREVCVEVKAGRDELDKQHKALLAKIRPISIRKDRGAVPGVKKS